MRIYMQTHSLSVAKLFAGPSWVGHKHDSDSAVDYQYRNLLLHRCTGHALPFRAVCKARTAAVEVERKLWK